MTDYFFFGPRHELLFGAVHAPDTAATHGVLICGAGLEEHHRTIWPLRSLADQLARQGLCAMRFDYFGTGDSYGDVLRATPSRWLQDIDAAVDEFVGRTSITMLSFLCVRLGASLFSQIDFDVFKKLGLSLGSLVLWDPVECGKTYLAELGEQESFRVKHQRHNFSTFLDPGRPELLGYAITEARRKETEKLQFDREKISRYFDENSILRVGSGNTKWTRQLNLEDGFLQNAVSAKVLSFLTRSEDC